MAISSTTMTGQEMVDLTKKHTLYEWSAQSKVDPIPVARAKGIYFWTPEGKRFIDFNSQSMSANIGHGDERVIRAIAEQASALAYANPFMATEPRARLGAKLAEIAPGDIDIFFFTNGGSDANENAIKIARVFTGRHKILARYRSYHGATAGAISITTRDPNGKLGAEADFTIGNYDQRRERVTLSSPQIGPFSAYVTFVHNYKRGDVRNTAAGTPWDRTVSPSPQGIVTTAAPYLGTVNSDSWFAALKFQPTANFKMVYKYDDDEENGSPEYAGVAAYDPNSLVAALVYDHPGAGIYSGTQRPDFGSNGFSIPSEERVSGHNLTATWNATDDITVKNVFAIRQTYMWTANSLDGFGGKAGEFGDMDAVTFIGAAFDNLP